LDLREGLLYFWFPCGAFSVIPFLSIPPPSVVIHVDAVCFVSCVSAFVHAFRNGIYVTTWTLDRYPELNLDFWRSLKTREAVDIFRAQWSVLYREANVHDPLFPNEYVCRNDSWYLERGLAPQGCSDYSVFIPPQCRANPTHDCGECMFC
jgi:hypothetical protein